MTIKKVRKAVFPVAGLGTRFLPATKASPKEMLTVVDKPLIQYAAEEAVSAGIKELIFVTSGAKRAIEDHFDQNYELEIKLAQKANADMLALVQNILPPDVSCVYVRQKEALGLGHAVLCARRLIGDEPFAVLLADDLLHQTPSQSSTLASMVEHYQKTEAGSIAVQTVADNETHQYGIVETNEQQRILSITEKPEPGTALSNQAVIGRYLLPPQIFDYLLKLKPGQGAGGEVQLTDAIAQLIADQYRIDAQKISGKRYDCGSKLGYLLANFDFALSHPRFGESCRQYLQQKLQNSD